VSDGSPHFRAEEIAPGVHALLAEPDRFALCNTGLIDLGGLTIAFDSALTPFAGAELRRWSERLTGRPPALLVTSHYHGDHVQGSGALAPVRVISTRRTRELLIERGAAHYRAARAEAPGELAELRGGRPELRPRERQILIAWMEGLLAGPEALEIVLPEILFERELCLEGTRRRARVLSFGGGHSPSDVLLDLPDEGVSFLGDLLTVGWHPSLSDGDPAALDRILGECAELGPRRAVPGHGPVGDATDILSAREYLRELERLARGSDLPGPAGTAPPIPEPYRGWEMAPFWASNFEFIVQARDRARAGSAAPAQSR
jgi:cyclase